MVRCKIVTRGVAGLVGVWIAGVEAREICVVCTGPGAAYRCVTDAQPGQITQAARLACLTTLARDGQHETCSVKASPAVRTCEGSERRVSVPALELPPAAAVPAAAGDAKPVDVKAGDTAAAKPPETVEQLAKQLSKASGEQINKTGASISEAARKTWGCVTSLFKAC